MCVCLCETFLITLRQTDEDEPLVFFSFPFFKVLLCKKLAEHPKAFPANLWELLLHKTRPGSSVTIQLVLAQVPRASGGGKYR